MASRTPLFFSLVTRAVMAIVVTAVSGCGGGDNDIFGSGGNTQVDEISADDSPILLGQATVVRVNFSFDNQDVFSDKGNVRLVVKLPDGLRLRPDSSEIDGIAGDDDGVGAQILDCASTGESYLLFDMDRFDLDSAQSPDSDSDAQLKFTVDATRRGAALVIEAKADEDTVLFGCNQNFVPDEQDVVSVQ